MKVIFLDVDGVLNTASTRKRLGIHKLCPDRLALLHTLVSDTNARVVLSSAWKHYHTIQQMDAILGLTLVAFTPNDPDDHRGREIQTWLRSREDIASFVILDDRNDMAPNMSKLVRTTDTHGLTARHIDRARRILNGTT